MKPALTVVKTILHHRLFPPPLHSTLSAQETGTVDSQHTSGFGTTTSSNISSTVNASTRSSFIHDSLPSRTFAGRTFDW
ncbi:hypothetical protein HanIR_Chr08g0363901 [Helianthus annuus]|nr:hypothetical protein HanIR_Chr08g0363901 [Helianthus annuus]